MSIKIPRRLDRAIDWVKAHPRASILWTAWAAATIAVVYLTALRIPVLYGVSGFVLGALHVGSWKAVIAEDLRQENARLRQQVAGLTAPLVPPVDTSADDLTTAMPFIQPEGERRV